MVTFTFWDLYYIEFGWGYVILRPRKYYVYSLSGDGRSHPLLATAGVVSGPGVWALPELLGSAGSWNTQRPVSQAARFQQDLGNWCAHRGHLMYVHLTFEKFNFFKVSDISWSPKMWQLFCVLLSGSRNNFGQWFSKLVPSVVITWELVKNARFQVHPWSAKQTLGVGFFKKNPSK